MLWKTNASAELIQVETQGKAASTQASKIGHQLARLQVDFGQLSNVIETNKAVIESTIDDLKTDLVAVDDERENNHQTFRDWVEDVKQ